MADIETIAILKVGTDQAVESIADLRNNIRELKKQLEGYEEVVDGIPVKHEALKIGTDQYKKAVEELKVNQAALKDAMYATSASMEDVAKAAKGQGESYNALVKQMADLKREFRSTEDATRRENLGKEIDAINTKLKDLDKLQGNYQRNVGNYKSALEGLSGAFKATAGSAGAVINPIRNMTTGLQALSATPAIAILGLLANTLTKVVEGLKSSEENTNAWNRALAAFKPIADSFTRSMQAVGKAVTDVANWIVDLLDKWGMLNEASQQRIALEEKNQAIIKRQRDIALENANLENEVAKLRDKAAQKDKYTAKERLQFLEDAVKWESRIAQNNMKLAQERLAAAEEEADLSKNSAGTNERINQLKIAAIQAETNFYTTTRRLQSQMVTARQEIAREGAASVKASSEQTEEAVQSMLTSVKDVETALANLDKTLEERRQARVQFEKETNDLLAEYDAELTASIQAELDAQLDAEFDAMLEERQLMQQRVQTFTAFASAIGNLAGSLADIYEADSEKDEEAAQKAKALKVAAAVINTIGGAVSAFTSTWSAAEIPLSAKMVLAPINAASVLAAGYAQVKQIQAVKVGKGGNSQAVVPAPTMPTSVTPVRSVTNASEEERLNQMASNQRVYILASDLQAERASTRVRIAETSF